MKLNEMIAEGDESYAEDIVRGSVLNPGEIGNKNGDKKSTAKPHAKIEAKINNRKLGTQATKKENVIWDNKDIKDHVEDKRENRPKPDFEVKKFHFFSKIFSPHFSFSNLYRWYTSSVLVQKMYI